MDTVLEICDAFLDANFEGSDFEPKMLDIIQKLGTLNPKK